MDPGIKHLKEWLEGRDETVKCLQEIADTLNNRSKTNDKVGIAGRTVGLLGVAAGKHKLLTLNH